MRVCHAWMWIVLGDEMVTVFLFVMQLQVSWGQVRRMILFPKSNGRRIKY